MMHSGIFRLLFYNMASIVNTTKMHLDEITVYESCSPPDQLMLQLENAFSCETNNIEIVSSSAIASSKTTVARDRHAEASTENHINQFLARTDLNWSIKRYWFVGIAFLALLIGGILFGIPLGVALHQEKVRYSNLVHQVSAQGPTMAPTVQPAPPSNITVAAFYYPWYTNNFLAYLRGALDPPQFPQLGPYDQQNPDVISQHLAWSRQANIGLWLTSWWGSTSVEDSVIKNDILTNNNLGNHKIALLYETTHLVPQSSLNGVVDDMHYIAQTYFGHPNYYRINDKPVIFIYLARVLNELGILRDFVYLLRSGASQMGYDGIYIIGDIVFGDSPAASNGSEWYEPFFLLDAVGTYDVYGSIGATGYAGQDAIDNFAKRQREWRKAAHRQGCAFIPGVSPGFNDRGVRSGHDPVSRQLDVDADEGSLLRALLNVSLGLVEANRNMTGSLLFVTSWNEWHEDSQIEPVAANPNTSTKFPLNLTAGLSYNTYGELYLDIMREATWKT
jgi:hypothetical protein